LVGWCGSRFRYGYKKGEKGKERKERAMRGRVVGEIEEGKGLIQGWS